METASHRKATRRLHSRDYRIKMQPHTNSRAMAMHSDASVTQWIDGLKAGDPNAAQKLWERYCRRLVGLARKKLRAAPRRAADEEDVALSAFDSFCRGAEQDRFPQLNDR